MYRQPAPTISFEFFPPKTDDAEAQLYASTVPALKKLGASFFSVTFGAGGGTRDKTLRIVSNIRDQFDIEAMSHLTCSGSTKETIEGILDEAKERGIENILALRGDPPKGEEKFMPTVGGFRYAVDLIHVVKARGFGCGAACYPEGHMECDDKTIDWDRAAAKVEAGADFLITQLFYDWNDFLEMEDYLRNRRKITVPIVPGVLPFLSAKQIRRFTSLCGARLSDDLQRQLDRYIDDDDSVRKLGVDLCSAICRQALDHGVPGVHFYCLNRTASVTEIMRNLGLAN